MPRSRNLPVLRTRTRPNRSWAYTMSAAVTNVSAASKVLIGSFSLSNAGIDETILRTHISLHISTDNAGASEEQFGAFGLIRVSAVALALGITAIPGPFTNGNDDGWFVHFGIQQRWRADTAVGRENLGQQYLIDSKAMRKIPDGSAIAVVAECAHATDAFDLAVAVRLLGQTS